MFPSATQFGSIIQRWQERFSCNNPECRQGRRIWRRVSYGTGSVQLAGKRYCFPACFEQELDRQLEQLRIMTASKPRSPHRLPLGLLMLSRGDLDHNQLRIALDTQRQNGYGHIGEWITQLGFAREQQVTAALGAQWLCPVLWRFPERLADCTIPLPLLRRFRMAPVHYASATRVLHIAFAGGIEYQALVAIEQVMQCRAEPSVTSSGALAGILARIEDSRRRTDHVFADSPGTEEMTRITSSYAARLRVQDTRMAQCGDFIWVRLEAGDDSVNLLFSKPVTHTLRARYPAVSRLELPPANAVQVGIPAITPEAACLSPSAG